MTLAALFSCAVTLRLGFWQLDRLEQRRELNYQLGKRVVAEPLRLPGPLSQRPPVDEALGELEFRPVALRGYWDYTKERALPNQFWDRQLGAHIVTPFVLEREDKALLVDRGWIPADSAAAITGADWERYRPPQRPGLEAVEVRGFLRVAPPSGPLQELRRQAERDGFDLLPFYVTESPPLSTVGVGHEQPLPYKRWPVASTGDGVHAIAAAQWFIISAIIVIGQVVYVAQREHAAHAGPAAR